MSVPVTREVPPTRWSNRLCAVPPAGGYVSRLDLSPSVRAYLELHAVDPDLAFEIGVRSAKDTILYEYRKPRGESFIRRRDLNDERSITKQPAGEPLILWWPGGRPAPGTDVLLAEGEPDALAAISALNGDPYAVAAVPGTGIPPERVTAELGGAGRVFLAMDGDPPGRKAADQFARALQEFVEIRVVWLGEGEDLASRLVRQDDRRRWLLETLDKTPTAPKVRWKSEDGGYRRKAADRTRDLLARGIDPEKLELGDLLDDLREFITDYIVLPDEPTADLLPLWTAHTWTLSAWHATLYLRLTSAAPDSAKTLVMEVLSRVCRLGWHVVNPSPAVLFRYIDKYRPTLFLDELDNAGLDEKRDAVAVLNAGYKPGAKVPRCNESGDLQEFNCFSAKSFAGLAERSMPPATLSRSATIRMEPKLPSATVKMWLPVDVEPRAADLRDRCRAWADRHTDQLRQIRPDLLGLTNRPAEVWWAILALGEHAGGEWTTRARNAALAVGTGGDDADRVPDQVQLLADIRAAFGTNNAAVFTSDLLNKLNSLEESPWGGRNRGDGISSRDLADMLRPFRVRPKRIRIGEENARGYRYDQFERAFERHLALPPGPGTSGTSGTTASHSHGDVPDVPDVPDPGKGGDTEDRTRQVGLDPYDERD